MSVGHPVTHANGGIGIKLSLEICVGLRRNGVETIVHTHFGLSVQGCRCQQGSGSQNLIQWPFELHQSFPPLFLTYTHVTLNGKKEQKQYVTSIWSKSGK